MVRGKEDFNGNTRKKKDKTEESMAGERIGESKKEKKGLDGEMKEEVKKNRKNKSKRRKPAYEIERKEIIRKKRVSVSRRGD